ncbi:hypothetical protein CALVIDRAFT_568986 [Calocera viscosa TUFC12733]|uniref:Endonuclease/exonuclease/phosphatase domain-containing protein n=1 Tax=Calocera viscosa (strain TUFC12733) TaxID=1330018 RepID=A0A167GHJ6_CALVF|nr:hypothetical protein CALVIDRAFT_568986 [Calocera viscosa TUFC12733]
MASIITYISSWIASANQTTPVEEYDRHGKVWRPHPPDTPAVPLDGFVLITWNIDGVGAGKASEERLADCLRLLKDSLDDIGRDARLPAVICLQGMSSEVTALEKLKADEWVQRDFLVITHRPPTPLRYDVVTLVSNRLAISSAFVYDFPRSGMERRALFVNLAMITDTGRRPTRVRVANTHLESLNAVEQRRVQLASTARLLAGADLGIICGDLNANNARDHEYPASLDLLDVWTMLRGGDVGNTWGHQGDFVGVFDPARLDKVLITRVRADESFKPTQVDVREGRAAEGDSWLSDHHFLVTLFGSHDLV